MLSASGNAVWLWDVRPGGQALSYPLLTQSELSHWAEPVAATALALSPDGQVLAAGMSHGLVLLLDRETGAVLRRLEASASAITILQFSPDGKQLLAVEADGAITVWDAATGATLGRLTDHLGPVRGLEARADGQLWAWGDHTLWQVRPTEGGVAGTTAVVSDTFMAASPAGDLLVGYHPFQASLWEPQTGALLGPLPGEAPEAYVWRFTEQGFYAADVSADGQTVAVGGTGGVWVHTLATGRFSILGQGSLARALALSPDNRHLAACFDSYSFEFGCALFDLTTTRVVQRLLQDRASGIRSMAFAPNGRRLFGLTDSSYSPNDLLLWDVSRGEILFQRALDGEATSLAVSPDGSLLAVGYVDGRLELRDAATLETLTTLPASRGAVRALAFAVDGSWLASGADDGTITIWAAGD